MFPASSICVVFSYQWNVQRFFSGHTAPVTCVALHPFENVVASGQVGHNPPICIWDPMPLEDQDVLQSPTRPNPRHVANLMKHTVGISCLAFSPDGVLLASVGGDSHHTVRFLAQWCPCSVAMPRASTDFCYVVQICIWDWRTGVLLTSAAGSSASVLAIKWNPAQYVGVNETDNIDEACYCLSTCGVGHVKFWTLHRPVETMDHDVGVAGAGGSSSPLHRAKWRLHGSRGSFSRSAEAQDAICLEFISAGGDPRTKGTRTPRGRRGHHGAGSGSAAGRSRHGSMSHSASASGFNHSGATPRRGEEPTPRGVSPGLTHSSPEPWMLESGSGRSPHKRTTPRPGMWVGRLDKRLASSASTPRSARSAKGTTPRSSGGSALRSAWCVSGMVRGDVYVWNQPPLSHLSPRKRRSQSKFPASACPWHQGAKVVAVMKVSFLSACLLDLVATAHLLCLSFV